MLVRTNPGQHTSPFGRHAETASRSETSQGVWIVSNPVNTKRRRLLGTTIAGLSLLDFSLSDLARADTDMSTKARARDRW
jgi:hypothetical protein